MNRLYAGEGIICLDRTANFWNNNVAEIKNNRNKFVPSFAQLKLHYAQFFL